VTEEHQRLASGLVASTRLLIDDGAGEVAPGDLAATLELYVRVAALPRELRRAEGLDDAFQAATHAWVDAGAEARNRAFQGLKTTELVEQAYQLADDEDADEESIVGWAAAAVRAALVAPWLDPEDRVAVNDAVGELSSVVDTHPIVFLPAAMVAHTLGEAEPIDRWPTEAAQLLSLFARLPLLAAVDGDL